MTGSIRLCDQQFYFSYNPTFLEWRITLGLLAYDLAHVVHPNFPFDNGLVSNEIEWKSIEKFI